MWKTQCQLFFKAVKHIQILFWQLVENEPHSHASAQQSSTQWGRGQTLTMWHARGQRLKSRWRSRCRGHTLKKLSSAGERRNDLLVVFKTPGIILAQKALIPNISMSGLTLHHQNKPSCFKLGQELCKVNDCRVFHPKTAFSTYSPPNLERQQLGVLSCSLDPSSSAESHGTQSISVWMLVMQWYNLQFTI